MDINALRNELTTDPLNLGYAAHITTGADGAIAELMNAPTQATKGALSAHDIRQYLMLHDLLLTIESGLSLACRAATRALDIFPVFELDKPEVLDKFTQILDGLIADTLAPPFTLQHKTDLLAMGDTHISRAQQLFGSAVFHEDIAKALRG